MCTLSQRDVYSDGRCSQMILEEYIFTSCFLNDIQGLIEQKKQSGYIYDSAKYIFIQFDKFCVGNECYIPSKFSAKSYRVPYVMNEREIKELFTVADDYAPKVNADRFNILAEEYKVLFRFIYCCGLRVSEARKLKLEDIDFERKTALILRSKGDKDRLIYIADDVCKMCLDMLDLLHDKYHFYSEYLFPSSDPNTPLQVASINKKFREFWKKTSGAPDSKYPTVHSLRYSFVVTRMNLWMEKGENLTAMMPYLSKYLGHESVENTYYYYHQIESTFKIVRQKDQLSDRIIPEVSNEE